MAGEFEYTARAVLPSGEIRWAATFGSNARISVGQPLIPRTITWYALLTHANEPLSPCHVMQTGECGNLSVPEIRPWVVRRVAEGWTNAVQLIVRHNVTIPAVRGRPVSLPLAAYALALLSFELWANHTPARVIRAVVGACLGLRSLPERVLIGGRSSSQAPVRLGLANSVDSQDSPQVVPPFHSRHEVSRILRRLWGSILAGRVADTLATIRQFPRFRVMRAIGDWGHPWIRRGVSTVKEEEDEDEPEEGGSDEHEEDAVGGSSSPFYPPLLSPNRTSRSFTCTEAQEYALMSLLDVAVSVPFGAIAADDEAGSDDRGGGGDPRGRASSGLRATAQSKHRWSFSEGRPGWQDRILAENRSQSAENLAGARSPTTPPPQRGDAYFFPASSRTPPAVAINQDTVFFDLTLSLTKHGGPWLLSQPLLTAVVSLLQTSENSMTRIHLLHLLHALYRPSVRSLKGWERWCRARNAVQTARMRGRLQRIESGRSLDRVSSPRASPRSSNMSPPPGPSRRTPVNCCGPAATATEEQEEGEADLLSPSSNQPRISSPLRPRPQTSSTSGGRAGSFDGGSALAMDDFLAMWRSRVVSEVAHALIKRVRVTSLSIQYAVAHETRIPVQLLRQGPSLSGGILGGDEEEVEEEAEAAGLRGSAEDTGFVPGKPAGDWRIQTSSPVDSWVRNRQPLSGDDAGRSSTPAPPKRATSSACSIPPAPRVYSKRSSNNMGPMASGQGSIDAATGVLVRPHAGVTVGCLKELLAFCGQVVTGYRALQVQEDPSWNRSRERSGRKVENAATKAAARNGGPDVAALSRSQLLRPLRTTFSAESEASVWKKRREHAWRRSNSSNSESNSESNSNGGRATPTSTATSSSSDTARDTSSSHKDAAPLNACRDVSAERSVSGTESARDGGDRAMDQAGDAGVALPPAVVRTRSVSVSRSRSGSESGSESDGQDCNASKSGADEKSPLLPAGLGPMIPGDKGHANGSDVRPPKLQLTDVAPRGGGRALAAWDVEPEAPDRTPAASVEAGGTSTPGEERATPDLLSLIGSTHAFGSVGPSKLVSAVGHCLVRLAPQVCGEYDHVLRCAASIAQADEGAARFLVHSVLQKWPHANSAKQVLLLKFLAASMPGWAFGPSQLRRELASSDSSFRSRSHSLTEESDSTLSGPSDRGMEENRRLLTCMTGPELVSLPRPHSLRCRLVHRVRKCLESDHAQLATVAASLCHPFPAGMEPSPFSRLLRRDTAAVDSILAALQSEPVQQHWNITVRKNAAVVLDALSKLEVVQSLPSAPGYEAPMASTNPSSAPSLHRPTMRDRAAAGWHASQNGRSGSPDRPRGGREDVPKTVGRQPPRPPTKPVGHGHMRDRLVHGGSVPGVGAELHADREELPSIKSAPETARSSATRRTSSGSEEMQSKNENEKDDDFEPEPEPERETERETEWEPDAEKALQGSPSTCEVVEEVATVPVTQWSREVQGVGEVTPAQPAVWTSPEHLYGRRPRSMTLQLMQSPGKTSALWAIMSALHLDSSLQQGGRQGEQRHRRKHRRETGLGGSDVEVDSSDSDHSGGSAPSRVCHASPPIAVQAWQNESV